MSLPYDYWITSADGAELGFNKKPSKDDPEERATAQFRKEQFDSTPTVGDQSLSGWWTRGQLSFHKGAGTLYYEVLEGETVLDRFDHSEGIDPFTPGQVTIGRKFDEHTLPSNPVDSVWVANYIVGDRLVVRCSDGKVYQVTVGSPFSSQTATQITLATAGSAVAVAASRFSAYIAVGKNIETWNPFGGTSTVLWTGSTGVGNIVGMWYAKQRLWVVDENGNWFSLSTVGGTFTSSDAKFTIKDYKWLVSSPGVWSLADSPGPIYIAAFNEVYSVTVEGDSLLPTIGAPTLAASLPSDETIYCLGHLLGTLVIGLGLGCRFATPGSNGLVYGPRITNVNFSQVSRIAAVGTRVAMGGFFFDSVGLWSFDLGQLVDSLEPAHALESLVSGAPMNGALNTPQGLVMWSSLTGKLYRRSAAVAASGYLTTGFHRFGTLDPKHFDSVLVRITGAGGSVDVYRVDADFTETLLGSVTHPATEAEMDLGLDVPTERVGLKFVLKVDPVDSTKVPTLLGYQLKALPIPKRQRMIRVPLLLFDYEVDGKTRQRRGAKGQAWSRLAALEALEESNAVVSFEDKETGEAGSAYIEAVEVRRTSPVGEEGYGGLLYLTLRKLA